MFDDDEKIFSMLKMGVNSYLTKNMDPEELIQALDSVMQKGFYYSEFVTAKLIFSLNDLTNIEKKKETALKAWKSLTEKEKEFIKLACSELTYAEIAKEMNVSNKTIDNHRISVFGKLGVSSRVGMVMLAIKNELIEV